MIRQVRGTVLEAQTDSVVLDVSGWGVFVSVADGTQFLLDTELTLHTYTAFKQDGVELFGFIDTAERRFFELLLGVSGVGPKTALGIFRKAPRQTLEAAIGARDLDYLTRVAGLSKKVAEKLLVELSDKVKPDESATPDADDGEVFDTLVALGYTDREARAALAKIPKQVSGKDARLKAALSAGA